MLGSTTLSGDEGRASSLFEEQKLHEYHPLIEKTSVSEERGCMAEWAAIKGNDTRVLGKSRDLVIKERIRTARNIGVVKQQRGRVAA